jgi:hypothetical protein
MNESGQGWEEDTVRAFFHEDLANSILQIPISRLDGDDFVSWPHDKHGVYSVRSAYNLVRTLSFFAKRCKNSRGSSSDLDMEAKMWKLVWAIKAPLKMKVTLWHIIHDCLPTGFQLRYRHISADDQCVFCGQSERIEHLLLFCPFARAVWSSVKEQFPLKLHRKTLVSANQWVFDFLHRENEIHAMALTVTCWHMWEARNEARNQTCFSPPGRIAARALAYIELVVSNLFKEKEVKGRGATTAPQRWVPPLNGFVGINVDAALFPAARRWGLGVVIHDHQGGFLLSCSEGGDGLPAPEMAEALSARKGLVIAKEHGFKKVELVSDCLSLVQRISSNTRDRSGAGIVISDIKWMTADFESCLFKFSNRKTNVVAHKLARSVESCSCTVSVGVILDVA